jgi:bacteriocin biosynthesis cyclodehydratase domain-containing protein
VRTGHLAFRVGISTLPGMANGGRGVSPPHALPSRPALKPWYRVRRQDDTLLFQYGETLVSFEGRAASRLLPVLLPLLDGSRSVDEIVRVLGPVVRPAVEKALGLLAEHELLTECPPEGVDGSVQRSADFLAATDPVGRSAREVTARLETAAVAVVGSGPLAAEVSSSLLRSGLSELERRPLDAAPDGLARFELAVAVPAGEELPRLLAWNDSALRAAVPWLQVLPFDGHFAAVGPLYVPDESACYECFLARRASNVDDGRGFLALQAIAVRLPAASSLEQAVAGLAATLALRWLANDDQFLPGTWYALELHPQLSLGAHVLYRVPRCRACSGLARAAQPLPWHKGAAAA